MITNHKFIKKGMLVEIQVEKTQDVIKTGHVEEILSKSESAKGVRVKLRDGTIGRVCYIPTKEEVKMEQFKYLNRLLYERQELYSIWDNKNRRYFTGIKSGHLISFVFSDKADAEDFLKNKLNSKEGFVVNSLNRKKLIVESFDMLGVTLLILDRSIAAPVEELRKKETDFRNLLKQTNKRRK